MNDLSTTQELRMSEPDTIEENYCWKVVEPDELRTPWLGGLTYPRFDRVAENAEVWGTDKVEISIISWENRDR